MSPLVGALSIAVGAVFLLFCVFAWVRFAPLRPRMFRPAIIIVTLGFAGMAAYQVWRGDLDGLSTPALFAALGAASLADKLTDRRWAWAAFALSALLSALSVAGLLLKPERDAIDALLAIFLTVCMTLRLRTTFTIIAARAATDKFATETGTPA